MSHDRIYPSGTLPAAVGALGALAAAVLAVAVVAALLTRCDRPGPVQMIPTPTPPVAAAAIASSSAQVVATQSVRVTVTRTPKASGPSGERPPLHAHHLGEMLGPVYHHAALGDEGDQVIVEVTQAITAAATSSAGASASSLPETTRDYPDHATLPQDHGRLGVVALTAPGILAADLQLARVDVPAWLVGVPLEVGVDVAANLEVAAVGVTVGQKGFVGAYGWTRWNLSAQGVALGAGLRF